MTETSETQAVHLTADDHSLLLRALGMAVGVTMQQDNPALVNSFLRLIYRIAPDMQRYEPLPEDKA